MLPLLLPRPPASCMEAALARDTGEARVYSGRWQTWGWGGKGSTLEPFPIPPWLTSVQHLNARFFIQHFLFHLISPSSL